VLATVLKMPDEEVDDYLRALAEMAEASGGGITDRRRPSETDRTGRATGSRIRRRRARSSSSLLART
jgi:hypothetical protein